MINKSTNQKINSQIERFFIVAVFLIIVFTLLVSMYFNQYDEQQKIENNLHRTHRILSQFIAPSLNIYDLSEVRKLLYMSSNEDESFLVVDKNGIIVMADYEQSPFKNFYEENFKLKSDCKELEVDNHHINGVKYFVGCTTLKNTSLVNRSENIGILLSFTKKKLINFPESIFYFVALSACLFILLIFLFRRMLYVKLLKPLIELKDKIIRVSSDISTTYYMDEEIKNSPVELIEIKNAFSKLILNLKDEYKKSTESEKMKALIDHSASVAHDIRSPLTALDMMIKEIENLSEPRRVAIRNALNRITDIANNLLTGYRIKDKPEIKKLENTERSELISDLLTSLISEKRAQHRTESNKINLMLDESSYGKFSKVSSPDFKRVLSNLIDNAIESKPKSIEVQFQLIEPKRLKIRIQDDGCGMSHDILSKIRTGVHVSNKSKGHGLGLSNATQTVKNKWFGEININSTVGIGTIVEILLPCAETPKWFNPILKIKKNDVIAILDDDESIHQVWKQRFNDFNDKLKFLNYFHPDELHSNQDSFSKISIFLIDYEFIGCHKNGLNIIEELNIVNRSYLITSRHEDVALRNRCEKLGLKIIPKTFAVYIPIIFMEQKPTKVVDAIFIDDDKAMTDAWIWAAFCKDKTISVYNSIHKFFENVSDYDFGIPIYIDSELNEPISGQEYARILYEMGFTNLYLATGHAANRFSEMFWIRKVISKEFPFD